MSKFDNHVYLTICEVALERFKESKFLNFTNYCTNIGIELNKGNLSGSHKNDLSIIIEMLDLVYTMDSETTGAYLNNFFSFNMETIRSFEKSVVLTQKHFTDT